MSTLSAVLVCAALAIVAFVRKVLRRKHFANLRGPESASKVFGQSMNAVTELAAQNHMKF